MKYIKIPLLSSKHLQSSIINCISQVNSLKQYLKWKHKSTHENDVQDSICMDVYYSQTILPVIATINQIRQRNAENNLNKISCLEDALEKSQYIGPSKVIMLLKPKYLDAAPAKPCQQSPNVRNSATKNKQGNKKQKNKIRETETER